MVHGLTAKAWRVALAPVERTDAAIAGPAPRSPTLDLLSSADYCRVRWKNGRGWTTELAARPVSGAFNWRVSAAEIDADCEFSS